MSRREGINPMSIVRTLLILALALGVAGVATALHLPGWTKHHANPVLPLGASGEWDSGNIGKPSVIYDGHTYHMWYDGCLSCPWGSAGGRGIGYATSSDGVSWVKHPDNPVLEVGAPGSWDSGDIWSAAVVLNGDGTYTMWYVAWEVFLGGGGIGMATSPDGVSWTKHPGNPVLTPGEAGAWDEEALGAVTVVFDGATYHLWYVGHPALSIGYATSPDGIAWAKHQDNPVFEGADGAQAWDQRLWLAAVFSEGDIFHMLYSGDTPTGAVAIGYASSPDGVVWTRGSGGAVLTPGLRGMDWDPCNIGWHGAMALGGLARVYYIAFGCPEVEPGLGLATVTMDEIAVEFPRADRLNDNRFLVSAVWWDADGNVGEGVPARLADDTGCFWFFDEANLEITIKVLDGCAINDRFWVFASGLTNVGVTLTVKDLWTGETVYYNNTLGEPFQPIQDTSAFDVCD